MGAVHGHPGAVHRSCGSENSWARVGLHPSRSQLATSGQLHGMKEEIGKTWASAMERDLVNDFYNENHMINPFGNLIDYRVYLSMWVLKKIDSIF